MGRGLCGAHALTIGPLTLALLAGGWAEASCSDGPCAAPAINNCWKSITNPTGFFAHSIATDNGDFTQVYWANYDGTVMRLTPK
jgi:hypothetical protein